MYEMLVGLDVSNDEIYTQYREAMKPMLESYGGAFGFDFVVSKVLLSQVTVPINRVFTIHFPNQHASDSFFSDSEYLKAKAAFFNASVLNTTIIARYEKTV